MTELIVLGSSIGYLVSASTTSLTFNRMEDRFWSVKLSGMVQ